MVGMITIRPLGGDDIPDLVDLEERTFPQPWSEGIFREELRQSNRIYLAADEDGSLIGYVGVLLVGEDAHITTLAVTGGRTGGGLGTRLVLEAVEQALDRGARQLTLEVRMSNRRAQDLYRRFGLGPVGVRKGYYRDEDALIMWGHDIDGPEYRARLDQIRTGLQ